MSEYSNVSAYRLVDLDEVWIRRQRPVIKSQCVERDLRGTIMLSPEGVNVALSGRTSAVRDFWTYFTRLTPFEGMTFKESFSDRPTFNRMLVKIKREIIAFGRPEIRPAESPSQRIATTTLKQWLDEGRDILLLDTRNDYEVDLGTFEGAIDLGLENFRSFPAEAERLVEENRDKPVVTFCTGGIRCEKAAPFLEQLGFANVYQLDGGILQYFDDCGGSHWSGECFVFDKRVALDPGLRETDTEYCYGCQHILHPDDMASPLYRWGESCPYCSK